MGNLKQLITGYTLVILFTLSMLIFTIQFLEANNPASPILNNTYINQTTEAFRSSAESIQTTSINLKDKLVVESNPIKAVTFPFLIIYAGYSVVIAFLSLLMNAVVLVPSALFTLLFGAGGTGGSSDTGFFIVGLVLNGLLAIGIILAVLKGMRTGDTG